MRLAWVIARKDLSLRIRDRSIFILGIAAPLLLAYVFNLVFGGAFGSSDLAIPYGVVDLDRGRISEAFHGVLDAIEEDGLILVTSYGSEVEGKTAVDDGVVRAVFVLAEGTSDAVNGGSGGELTVIGSVDAPTSTGIATAIAEQFSIGVRTLGVLVGTGMATGVLEPAEIPAIVESSRELMTVIEVEDITALDRRLDPATYFVAGLSVYFMFFLAGQGTTSMLEERNEGTLSRLLAAPMPRATILVSKALSSIVLSVGSLTVLVVASSFVMDANWGPPLGVALLVGAAALAAVAIMSVAGTFARTAEQAGNLQSIVATAFAMLGGTFVPIAQDGGFLARLALATPNAWFLRGLGDMAGGGIADALPAVGVLMAMTSAAAVVGIPLARKGLPQ